MVTRIVAKAKTINRDTESDCHFVFVIAAFYSYVDDTKIALGDVEISMDTHPIRTRPAHRVGSFTEVSLRIPRAAPRLQNASRRRKFFETEMERTEKIMGHMHTASPAFEPIAYERVSVQEANQAVEDKRPAFQKDWTRLRLPQLPEPLLHTTSAWLAELPREVRTLVLAQQFPRIVNKLARLWRNPVQFEHYISDLLLVRRGDSIR